MCWSACEVRYHGWLHSVRLSNLWIFPTTWQQPMTSHFSLTTSSCHPEGPLSCAARYTVAFQRTSLESKPEQENIFHKGNIQRCQRWTIITITIPRQETDTVNFGEYQLQVEKSKVFTNLHQHYQLLPAKEFTPNDLGHRASPIKRSSAEGKKQNTRPWCPDEPKHKSPGALL